MEKIKVSGSIVTYNNSSEIRKCLDSLFEQVKGVDFTLYVIDNDSHDNTVNIIEEEYPQVILIKSKDNVGFGKGHNKVLRYLNSDFHVCINPDIQLKQDAITRLANFMKKNPSVGIAAPKVLNPDGSEQYLPKRQPCFAYVILSKFKYFKHYRDVYTMKDHLFVKPTAVDNMSGSFFMIRTDVFKELGGFDDRYFMYFEDADLARSTIKNGYKVVFYPKTEVTHEWKRANTKSFRGVSIFLKSMLQYECKWKLGR